MIPTSCSNPTDQGSAEAAGNATTGPWDLASPSVALTTPRQHCVSTGCSLVGGAMAATGLSMRYINKSFI